MGEFVTRAATKRDADAIARIYNEGIEDGLATFETEPRGGADISAWFDAGFPLVVVEDGVMRQIPRRDTLLRCQTPQGFRLPVITRAHELALADPDYEPTDDCGVVLRYLPGVPVHVVEGSEQNLKITYPRDLAIARALLAGD